MCNGGAYLTLLNIYLDHIIYDFFFIPIFLKTKYAYYISISINNVITIKI